MKVFMLICNESELKANKRVMDNIINAVSHIVDELIIPSPFHAKDTEWDEEEHST